MNKMQEVKENSLVVISNELTEANYKLTIAEQKFILALISQIDTRKENFETIKVSAKSLSNACGFNPKNGYRQLQQVIKKIFNRSIVIKKRNGTGFQIYNWMQFCDYFSCKDEDNIDCSHIEFELDRRLCPHFLQLKNRFLEIGLNHLISFNHIYSTRFYIIFRNLINNLPQCQKKYSFQDIIQMFQLSATYQKTANLKYVVIRTAIDEINEKSDIEVKYQYYREGGRAHIGVIFTVIKKTDKKEIAPPAADEAEQPPQLTSSSTVDTAETAEVKDHSASVALLRSIGLNPPSSSVLKTEKKEEPAPAPAEVAEKETTTADRGEDGKLTAEQQADYDLLIKYEIWQPVAKKFVDNYSHAQIQRNIEGVLKSKPRGNIRDMSAVLVNAIANDTYKGLVEEQAQALEREKARRKTEYDAIMRATKEKEENRKNESEKSKKLEEIRTRKSKNDLIKIFEKISLEYKNNNEILSDKMTEELEKNGIPRSDFTLYLSSMRNLIKYI